MNKNNCYRDIDIIATHVTSYSKKYYYSQKTFQNNVILFKCKAKTAEACFYMKYREKT